MDKEQFDRVRKGWSGSACYWKKHTALVRRMFAPVTRAMIEEAQIEAGQSVLDLAGGTGEPSLAIAKSVGSGLVVCTDITPGMVIAAKSESEVQGLNNLHVLQCSAERLPFISNAFDRIVSRFGVMFFENPSAASIAMLRVVRPGGRLCFATWGPAESNPFFRLVTDAVSHYVETLPEEPDAPGAFRFAEAGTLAKILQDAGVVDVRERFLNFRIKAPLPLEGFWKLRYDLSDSLREKAGRIPAEALERLKDEVEVASRQYVNSGQMNFPARALIVTGSKN
jgi:SAM-dependent methyltransferase